MLYQTGQIRTADRGVKLLFGTATFTTSGALVAASTVSPGFSISKPAATTGLYRVTLTDPAQRILGLSASYYGSGANHGRSIERRAALSSGTTFDFAVMSGRTTITHRKAQDAAAATATTETAFGALLEGGTLTDVFVIPDQALTADNTNNATITVSKRDSAGANKTTIATLTTNVAGGSWVQYARKALTITTAGSANVLAAGSGITLEISKAGTGVQIPALTLGFVLEGAPVDATSGDVAEFIVAVSDSGSRV